MSSIDNRIVEMQFNNQQFERNVKTSMGTLDKLKKSLNLEGSAKGLQGLENSAKRFSLAGMAGAVMSISDRFSTLGIVGMTVISDLTRSAMRFAKRAAGMVLSPILEGGKQRALNLEQARFQFQGLGMDIEAAMEDALYAVEGTAYGLDEAAKVASQFGASGMETGENMKTALRAISGVAAMTNSSYEDIGHIFTTVSGNGRLMGQQLLQLSGRGINAAAAIAKSMGTTEEAVRKMVTAGEISFEDFYSAMDEAFGEHAMKANETYSGSLSNVKAALARLGAETAANKLVYMRDIFNSLIPAIDGFKKVLDPFIKRYNTFMTSMAQKTIGFIETLDFSPVEPALQGVFTVFTALKRVLGVVRQAFVEVFPTPTVESLTAMATKFQDLSRKLIISKSTAEDLKSVFRGVFSILGIGYDAITSIIKALFNLSGEAKPFGSTILSIAAGVGEAIVVFREWLQEIDIFTKAIGVVTGIVKNVANLIRILFTGTADSQVSNTGDSFIGYWENFSDTFQKIVDGVSRFSTALWDKLNEMASKAHEVLSIFTKGLRNSLEKLGIDPNWDAPIVMGFAALIFGISKAFQFLMDMFGKGTVVKVFKDLVSNISGVISGATVSLKTMQNALRASALLQIAVAIGLLAGSLMLLSTLKTEELSVSFAAITGLMIELVTAMTIMDQMASSHGFKSIMTLGALMIGLAAGVLLLSTSLRLLSGMNWSEMAAGLTGVTVLLGSLILAANTIKADAGGLAGSAVGIILMAGAVRLLSGAVVKLGQIDTDELIRGLLGVVGILVSLSAASKLMTGSKGLITLGVVLIPLSAGLMIFAQAIKMFGSIDSGILMKGLISIAAGLTVLAVAAKLMTGTLAGAAAILVISASLILLGSALKIISSISIGDLAKSIIAIAAAFLLLGGIAALLAPVAVALVLLGSGIALVGAGIALIGGGVLAFAAGLTLLVAIGVTGITTLGLVLQGLLALASTLLPAVIALLGKALSSFLNMIIESAPKMAEAFLAILQAIITVVIDSKTMLMDALKDLITSGLQAVREIGTEFQDTFAELLTNGLKGVQQVLPEYEKTILLLLDTTVSIIKGYFKKVQQLGFDLIINFLKGIANNMPKVVKTATDIIVNFLKAISKSQKRVVQAGIDLIIDFINNMANAIRDNQEAMFAAMENLITAMLELAVGILTSFIPTVGAKGMAIIKEGLLGGIKKESKSVPTEAKNIMTRAVKALGEGIRGFFTAGADAVAGFVRGLGSSMKSVRDKATSIASTALTAAKKFLQTASPSKRFDKEVGQQAGAGMARGIKKSTPKVKKASTKMAKSAYEATKEWIDKQVKYHNISLDKQLSKWKSTLKKYKKGQDEYYEILLEIQAIKDKKLEEREAKAEKKREESLARSKRYIKEEQDLTRMSLFDELEAWERVRKKHMKGTKQREEADKEYARVRREIIDKMKEIDQNYYKSTQEVNEKLIEDIKKVNDEYEKAVEDRAKSLAKTYGLFDAVEEKEDVASGSQLIQNLESQKEAIDLWGKTMEDLVKRGLGEGVIGELRSLGPKSLAEVTSLSKLTDAELKKYSSIWDTIQVSSKDIAVKELEELKDETKNKIKDLRAQAREELTRLKEVWKESTQELTDAVVDEYVTMGDDIIETLRALKNQTRTNFDKNNKDMKTIIKSEKWDELGLYVVEGITKGVTDGSSGLMGAMVRMARAAKAAVEAELGIKSPSTVFMEIGKHILGGLIGGVQDRRSLKELTSAMGIVKDSIADNMDVSPVIRPVLDMSNLESADFASIFGDQRLEAATKAQLMASKMDREQKPDSVSEGKSSRDVTFTQYNYSPKALSRSEIYRQTRNQISQFKEVSERA